jgi:hypothetical protein
MELIGDRNVWDGRRGEKSEFLLRAKQGFGTRNQHQRRRPQSFLAAQTGRYPKPQGALWLTRI